MAKRPYRVLIWDTSGGGHAADLLGSYGSKAKAVEAGTKAVIEGARALCSFSFRVSGPDGRWWYRRTFPEPGKVMIAGVEEYDPPTLTRVRVPMPQQ